MAIRFIMGLLVQQWLLLLGDNTYVNVTDPHIVKSCYGSKVPRRIVYRNVKKNDYSHMIIIIHLNEFSQPQNSL